MSVSPRQNFLKPPPVPEMPTVTRTSPLIGLLELLGNRLGDREDGARSVDGDGLGLGKGLTATGDQASHRRRSRYRGRCGDAQDFSFHG